MLATPGTSTLKRQKPVRTQNMTSRASARRGLSRSSGFSLIELLIVCGLVAICSAIAIPQLIGSSRLLGSAGIPREMVAYLRFARQQAIAQKVVYSCTYNDQTKQVTIINHGETGITYDPATDTMVKLPGNTAASANVVADVTVEQQTLVKAGVPGPDIIYGRPSGAPVAALDDGTQLLTMPASKLIVFTFQTDGSIVDSLNRPINRSLFIYNNKIPKETAFAISVLGTTGRIKLWRYVVSATNASKYVE